VIDKILQPLLSLHGWQAYLLVGALIAAEAAIMIGFVFPGETAAILGGVLASKGGVTLAGMLAVVIVCAIVGDSIGYWVGDKWGRQLLRFGPLKKRQKGIDLALDQLARRGPVAVFVGRFTAFLRAVIPGLAGVSKMRYRVFLPANVLGAICWGTLYVLLGYFVGERVEKVTGIASDILLGLIVVVIVVLYIRHRRKEKREFEGPAPAADPLAAATSDGAATGTGTGDD
jgi:membrane protein DedA with SNARE-associated domain